MAEELLELDYEVFDRQVENLMAMSRVLATEIEDCSMQEMTHDLVSLQTKSSRLCYMADVDYALQQTEISHVREEKNKKYHEAFEVLMAKYVSPTIMRIVEDDIRNYTAALYKHPSTLPNLSTFLPRLKELVMADGETEWQTTLDSIEANQALFAKKLKLTTFPGMQPAERFWRLFLYYLQMCYLMYHFRRTSKLCGQEIEPKEMGRLLTAAIQHYALSEEGSKELELLMAKLKYNSKNALLSVEEMQDAQKVLLNEVPDSLQLCYIKHINNIDSLGQAISKERFSNDDLAALVKVIAKWQMLESQIECILHPKASEESIYNEVFHTNMNGKAVNLKELKTRIERMLTDVYKKNQWICVWCVLKHHNLLRNTQLEPFARQMMHKDWFGGISEETRIKGDTLRDYTGYFTMYDYTRWDTAQFNAYCEMHHKTKWSASLFNKLLHTCISMEELYEDDNWR